MAFLCSQVQNSCLVKQDFVVPTMAQCPGCMRMFTSQRYLASHLRQSGCSTLLGSVGRVPSKEGTSSIDLPSSLSHQQPPAENASITTDLSPHPPFLPATFDTSGVSNVLEEVDDDGNDGSVAFPLSDCRSEATRAGDDVSLSCSTSSSTTGAAAASTNMLTETIFANESLNAPEYVNDSMIPMLKLMIAIRKAGAPLNLLDSIVKILKYEAKVGRLEMQHLCTNRTAIKRIQKLFPSLPPPVSVTITHERTTHEMKMGADRPSLTFPVFPFLGQLEDLLNDHLFSDLNNLVVDPKNRWGHYQKNTCPHSLDELQDGDWFQGIVNSVSSDPPPPGINDFIIGIQGYIDKTGTDAYQRTTAEPLVITLTLFTNSVRNSPANWRVLALLPSSLLQSQKKQHAFGASVRNYHIALHAAFKEFIHLQNNPPMVRVRLGDEMQVVRARLVWINTIADGLANEHLVGRIQNRTSSPRLSRGCHCPQHMADDTQLQCNFLRQAPIQRLVVAALGPAPDSTGWDQYLQTLTTVQGKRMAESCLQTRKKIAQSILKDVFGQHVVDLVWFHVNQGPNPRGCFGATPVDPMHAFEEGVVPNILSVILDPLQESAKSSLDALALSIVGINRWNSEYPRMNFSGGFSSLTQLTADEKVGKLLLLWIVMQTPKGRQILEKRCDKNFDAQRSQVAARFSGRKDLHSSENEDTEVDDQDSTDSDDMPGRGRRGGSGRSGGHKFVGSHVQREMVKQVLEDHALHFIIPWINQMIPFHQDILHQTVFNICVAKGKGQRHILPEGDYLDRYATTIDVTQLYDKKNEDNHEKIEENAYGEAQYSIDCTVDELLTLIDMLLSFHATYKYGRFDDKTNFGTNTRIMMAGIKSCIRRGRDTKNWSISKFHELLHFTGDIGNFGSSANVDAGKGEHGLKVWAKNPSRTVRTRSPDFYYKDMATRIHENQLIQLASSTIIPKMSTPSGKPSTESAKETWTREGDKDHDENHPDITITLSNRLLTLQNTLMISWLEAHPESVLPIELYQEASYTTSRSKVTLRAAPNYRSSGPWYDWVMVQYEMTSGERLLYPFQIHGFLVNKEDEKVAVGKLGQRPMGQHSELVEKWSMEEHFRLVNLQTVHEAVFAIKIPRTAFLDNERRVTKDHVLILRDRIGEWPRIFNTTTWRIKKNEERNTTKKRKKTN